MIRRVLTGALTAAVLTGTVITAASPAGAADLTDLLVTQTNGTVNELVVIGRHADGSLEQLHRVPTGLAGSGHYLNTGNAIVAFPGNMLLAVDAGSNAVSVMQRAGTALTPVSSFFSGGDVPTSLAVHGSRVYVLNTGLPFGNPAGPATRVGPPTVQGFDIDADGHATAIPGARRSLPGACRAYPCTVTDTFGQASVSPDGSTLVITATGRNRVYTLPIAADGSLGRVITTTSTITQPYGYAWTPSGVAVVSGAAGNAIDPAIFGLVMSGRIVRHHWTPLVPSQRTLGAGTCWVAMSADGTRAYAIDAGGAVLRDPAPGVTTFRVSPTGTLTPLGFTSVPFSNTVFPLDSAVSGDGRALYSTSFRQIYAFSLGDRGIAHYTPALNLALGKAGLGDAATGLVDLPLP